MNAALICVKCKASGFVHKELTGCLDQYPAVSGEIMCDGVQMKDIRQDVAPHTRGRLL